MAKRIHVVGAYQATEVQLRDALDLVGDAGDVSKRFRTGANAEWAWGNASVWHVDGTEIDKALGSLSGPALRVTSSDGVLWTLTLTDSEKDTFRAVHYFTLVGSDPEKPDEFENDYDDDFLDDESSDDDMDEVAGISKSIPELQFLWDEEEADRLERQLAEERESTVEGLDQYTDYGVTLPDAVVSEMKRSPDHAAYLAFMAHGEQIVTVLEDFGFEFDREETYRLLTVGPLTEVEEDSDFGNMPRFLRTLGIDGVFQDAASAEKKFKSPRKSNEPVGRLEAPDGSETRNDSNAPLDTRQCSAEPVDWVEIFRGIGQALEEEQKANVAPHKDIVVCKGRTGKFLRASMSDLNHISKRHLKKFNSAMAELGFRFLGDFVGDVDQRQEITRCFSGHPQAIAIYGQRKQDNRFAWAGRSDAVELVDFSKGIIEFHTHFADGSTLVTTSLDTTTSKPEFGIYIRCYEDVPVSMQWKKHVDGIWRFEKHRGVLPIDHAQFADPKQFLKKLDRLFYRFLRDQ